MIPVQNIYYMLAYAFKVLNENGYKSIAIERFENVGELCARILEKGIKTQLKRGLKKDYITKTDSLSSLRGRINMSESIKNQTILKKQMVCTVDDFSINIYLNQVLKTTLKTLLISDISKSQKVELRKLLVYFNEVEILDIHNINWRMQFNRNNQNYRMLISICYLIIKGLLQTKSEGSTKLMDFDEQDMSRLYEKFILEYYRKEFPQIKANASQISWKLDDENDLLLPIMQSDITLSKDEKTLIIDAKYYAQTTKTRYNVQKLHSGNLYQIFTYVKNKHAELNKKDIQVSGMLLYAKTDELISINNNYKMSGNAISVRTLDLDCDFYLIVAQLNSIVKEYFGIDIGEV